MSSGLHGISWGLIVGTCALFITLALTHYFVHLHALYIPAHLIGANRLALWIYTLVMLPGIIVHEMSHAITALLLLVEITHVSIGPVVTEDGISLGHVQFKRTDIFRHSLIGLAPLIVGTVILLLISIAAFDLPRMHDALTGGHWPDAVNTFAASFSSGWTWLALYFIFAISATMFPSESDQKAWLPVLLYLTIIVSIGTIVGLVPILMEWLAGAINAVLRWLILTLGIALIIDLPILFLLVAATQTVNRQFPHG